MSDEKLLMWMRGWRSKQQRYEYIEKKHEENMEKLISGLGVLVIIILLAILWMKHI